MPEYLAPGVYVEEIDTGAKPIEGVSTSTAGFVGVTQRGPVQGPPVLVTSFPDFQRRYGGYLPALWGDSRFLAYAVQGFFENGGQRVYIQRVPGDGAQNSAANLREGIVTRLQLDMLAAPTSARLVSTRGITNGTNLTFNQTVGGVPVSDTVTVTGFNVDTGEITWAGALGTAYTRTETSVVIRAPSAGTLLAIAARDPGVWGDDLRVSVEYTTPARSAMVSNLIIPLLPITAAPTFAGAGPGIGATNVNLNAGHGLQTNDVVEFVRGTTRERRTVTVAANTISWTQPLANDFSVGSSVRLVTAARVGDTSVNITPALATRLRANDTVVLNGAGGTSDNLTVAGGYVSGTSPVTFTAGVTHNYLEGDTLTMTQVAIRTGENTLRVQSARNFYSGALVGLDNGTDREYFAVTGINGNALTLSGATAHDYHLGNLLRLLEFKLSVRYRNDTERIDQLETFDGLSLNANTGSKYVVTAVNNRSRLVTATMPAAAGATDSPTTLDGDWMPLSGGNDGSPPTDLAFIGQDLGPGTRTGIQSLIDIDQISIVAVPGKTSQQIQNALITHCETLKDRIAVIDPPHGADMQAVQDFRNRYDTKYAAIYYPWITLLDPFTLNNLDAPPSGHIVGIYARSDTERGVHKAPANEMIRGILDLEQHLNKREQDILNPTPVHINVLRDFRPDGRGLRVWGARCLTNDSDWKYVNVRRLFIFLEESLDDGTQWVVFEPNDERLWARVRQSVTNFLTRVWRDGALMGLKPEDAFFVRCDRTTMTQDDIDNGRLIMVIGVAPVYPAEFVIIRIGQWAGGSSVEEV